MIKFILYYFIVGIILLGPYTLIFTSESPFQKFIVIISVFISILFSIIDIRKRVMFFNKRTEFFIIWSKNVCIIFLLVFLIFLINQDLVLKDTKIITFLDKLIISLFLGILIAGNGTVIGFIRLYFSDKKIQKELWEKEIEHKKYLQELESQKRKQEEEDKNLQREFYKKSLSENNKMTKYDELEKLAELLEKNIITQEEFDNKKKEILE